MNPYEYMNPYMPYTAPYNPYTTMQNQQGNSSKQMMNHLVQPSIAPVSNVDWIRVNNMEDIQNVSVQPGQKAWIMLTNEPVFAVKTANDMGLTSTQAFRFEPYTEEVKASVAYATKEDFEMLKNEIEALKGVKSNGKSAKQSVPDTE
jgi:hypothetical protein